MFADETPKWRSYLAGIIPESCYNIYAKTETSKVFNWALFTAASETMRNYIGLCDTSKFIDIQLASQIQWLDENGMYRDDIVYPPMVYDLVSRGLFSIILDFGYRGKYYETIDKALEKAGLYTLDMQSVSGEIAYGGRSNQFLHNEAHLVIVFEYEAKRYKRVGKNKLAGLFKSRISRALDDIEKWITREPVRHIKNRFPTETRYGCEEYAYFDKYMITVASFLYAAYLICDDSIKASESNEKKSVAAKTSDYFNKTFLKNRVYALELDTEADPKYGASGLGRVHRVGAPSAICMSLPCPEKPNFVINEEPSALSLAPCVYSNGEAVFGYDGGVKHGIIKLFSKENKASAELESIFPDGKKVISVYTLDKKKVTVKVKGEGKIGFTLPAFSFDGEAYTDIELDSGALSVSYMGWRCRYTTNGDITDLQRMAYNRNGHYRTFVAEGDGELEIKIEITKI